MKTMVAGEPREVQFVIERGCPQAHRYRGLADGTLPYCTWVKWPAEPPNTYRDCDATTLYRVAPGAYTALIEHFRFKTRIHDLVVCEHMGYICE